MAVFAVRYDLRCPDDAPVGRSELYGTALEQAAYVDEHGLDDLVISEHHGVPDGYLPSPVPVAAAMAARTTSIRITVAALLLPLYDPLRLAEDTAVVDHVSDGRVSYVFGLGYRPEEYEQLDVDWSRRGQRMEHCLSTLLRAWTGEPFEHEGRTVRVTPAPASDPHPLVMYGGGSEAAARRAGRFGLGFFPQHADEQLAEVYRETAREHGHERAFVVSPPERTGTYLCARDPDRFWEEHGHHLLHEARSYASWQRAGSTSPVHDGSETVAGLRAGDVYRVCTPRELVEVARGGPDDEVITTHPLIGGLPPEASWRSLRLIAEEVVPAVREG